MAGPGLLAIPPLVEGIKWLGIAIGGLILGQAAVQTAEEVRRNARTTTLPMADTCVGNCGPPPDPCKTGNFDDLECEGGEHRHHIISDYVLRTGTRADTAARLPGAPSLNQGPSVCVSPATHGAIHAELDRRIAALGTDATIGQAKDIAMEVLERHKPECRSKMDDIRRQLDDAFSGMDANQPLRTTRSLPSAEEAARLLRSRPLDR